MKLSVCETRDKLAFNLVKHGSRGKLAFKVVLLYVCDRDFWKVHGKYLLMYNNL